MRRHFLAPRAGLLIVARSRTDELSARPYHRRVDWASREALDPLNPAEMRRLTHSASQADIMVDLRLFEVPFRTRHLVAKTLIVNLTEGAHLMDKAFGLLWIPAGFLLMLACVAGLFLTI